ncbi:hypothetical protein ANO11243_060690 [Dothideomycetidae sp. 11243]|nr:hypothetical protein ANO11243_060690 [fungal sp. No.11243]
MTVTCTDFVFRASGYPAASFPPSGPASQRGFKRPGPSERALLRTRRSPTPEQLVGMNSMVLHDELQNFYFYASPRAVERHMRADLIDRVTRAFSNESQRITVRTFGSSATNLYLPTGDVDLVVLSAHYRATGRPNIPVNRAALNRFVRNNITGTGLGISPQVIPAAKVPIIKFTDKKTGLPVDVSFENDSGVAALNTLDDWSEEYPALKRLVFPIKQLLKMRGLNEVNTGGLGGFSSICLVAFRLHHLSVTKSSQWSMENLDLALLDILDFYSTFDLEVDGLDMRSMSIIPKGFRPSKPGRLLIVDPNNSENDISGGTGKIKDIFAMFKSAAQSLRTELEMARNVRFTGSARWSMLNCILGGDYSSFELQRQRLEALSSSETRSTTMQIDLTASDGEYSPADVPVPAPQALIARIPTISVVPSQNGGRFDVPGPPRQPAKQAPPKTKAKQKSVAKKQQPPAVSDSVPATRSSKRKTTNQQQDPPRPAKKAKQNKSKSDQSGVPVNGQPPKESNPPETKKSKAKKKRDMAAASRVSSFKQQFPGVPCPEKMDKIQYRQMVKQQTQAQTAH